jgi:hypothetical protein
MDRPTNHTEMHPLDKARSYAKRIAKPPATVTTLPEDERTRYANGKAIQSLAFSMIECARQLRYIAENSRRIADELEWQRGAES